MPLRSPSRLRFCNRADRYKYIVEDSFITIEKPVPAGNYSQVVS
jgi:hypothetical protein